MAEAKKALASESEGCMPVAVLVFDRLMRLSSPPEDIQIFLMDFLRQLSRSPKPVEEMVGEVIPGYGNTFEKLWRHDKRSGDFQNHGGIME